MNKGARSSATLVPQMRTAGWVAIRLGVSKVWVRKLRDQGLLPGYLIGRNNGKDRGGRLLFRESDVLDFLRNSGVPVDQQRGGGGGA